MCECTNILTIQVYVVLLVLILALDICGEGGEGEGVAQRESSEGVEHLSCYASPAAENAGAAYDALLEAIP